MSAYDEVLRQAKSLPAKERHRLAKALTLRGRPVGKRRQARARTGHRASDYAALFAAAGTMHSKHADISSNKYEHVAASILREDE